MRALVSVSNHSELVPFAEMLVCSGFDIISTGTTAAHLKDARIPCQTVMEVTGFNESLDGRLTMFHPRIFAGLIADMSKESNRIRLARQKIEPFNLLVVNLAEFPARDDLDVGRFCLLVAAAINFGSVTPIVDPADYRDVSDEIRALGSVTDATRLRLATKALYISTEWANKVARQVRKLAEANRAKDSDLVKSGAHR